MSHNSITSKDFQKALEKGRPENIKRLFPNSHALIVSGKYIDRAMMQKGKSMTIAANGRNYFVLKGALMAAQRANRRTNKEIVPEYHIRALLMGFLGENGA